MNEVKEAASLPSGEEIPALPFTQQFITIFLMASNWKLIRMLFFKIHFNIILQLKGTFLKLSLRFCFSDFTSLFILHIIHVYYMRNLPQPLIRELEMLFSCHVYSKSMRLRISDCAESRHV
jgi:hypothetical protein